jgi:hypothetical protein
VFVTQEMNTSLMELVKLVELTVYGAKINVFVILDFS